VVKQVSILLRKDPPESKSISVLGTVVPPKAVHWLARLWIAAVIVGSLLPGSAKVALHTSNNVRHRLIHFFAFGSSFLVLSLLATTRQEELQAAAEVLVMGCIVELAQYSVSVFSHRPIFEWWDVRDDAIGIAVAFLLIQVSNKVKLFIASRFLG
jgi:FtsH-binding integral membrane protein